MAWNAKKLLENRRVSSWNSYVRIEELTADTIKIKPHNFMINAQALGPTGIPAYQCISQTLISPWLVFASPFVDAQMSNACCSILPNASVMKFNVSYVCRHDTWILFCDLWLEQYRCMLIKMTTHWNVLMRRQFIIAVYINDQKYLVTIVLHEQVGVMVVYWPNTCSGEHTQALRIVGTIRSAI